MIDELFSQKLTFSQESILKGKCGGITIFKDFVKNTVIVPACLLEDSKPNSRLMYHFARAILS